MGRNGWSGLILILDASVKHLPLFRALLPPLILSGCLASSAHSEFPLHCVLSSTRLLTGKPRAPLTTVSPEGRSLPRRGCFSSFQAFIKIKKIRCAGAKKLPLFMTKSSLIARLTCFLLPCSLKSWGRLSQSQPSALPEQIRGKQRHIDQINF